MNDAWTKLTREPALLLGVATAFLGLLALFGVPLTSEQVGGIMVFLGALTALLRFVTTPTAEVITQQKAGEAVKATAVARKRFGIKKNAVVKVVPVDPEDLAEAA